MPPLDPQAQQILNQRNGVQAPAQPAQPRPVQPQQRVPVFGPPVVPDLREIQSDQRDETRLGIAVRGEQRDITNQGFNQANTLRDEYRTEPLVREYGTSIEQFAAGLNSSPDAAGDQALITAYAKMLDPGSVVREGEFATTGQADNTFGQTLARIQREFGIEGGGRLSDTARARVRAEMRNLVVQRVQRYDQLRRDYEERARRAGIDPFEVVGTHVAAPYVEMLLESDRERGIGQGGAGNQANPQFTNPQGPQGPRPTLQDMYPEGAQLGMDNFGSTDPFDRIEYLRGRGVEPDAERQFVGIVNALARQKGAENFTREDMLQAYQQAGIQPGPDASIDEVVAQIRAGSLFAGFDTQSAEAEYTRMLDQRLQGENPEGMGATIGSAASQGVTLGLADEGMGVAEAISAALRGENPIVGYQVGRDTDRRFAQRSQEANPLTYGGTEFVAGLTTAGVRAAPAAMRAARPVAAAAREGAVMGGIAGFGNGEGLQGSLGGGAIGAGIGAGVGAGIAAAAPRVGNALANLRSPRPAASEVQGVVQAGERMDVPVRRADVDPAVRDTRANILQSPAGQTVRQTESDDLAALEQAVIREVGGGATTERFVAGDRAQSSLRAAIQSTRDRASSLYQRSARAMGDVAAEPTEALAAVDRHIAELSEAAAGNAPAINYLRNTIRADLTREGGLTIRSLLAQRRGIGRRLRDANLSDPDFERRVGDVYAAAAQDLESAAANNPEALAQLQQANRLWASQANVRREVGDLLLGRGRDANVPPRQAAERILGWAKNDPSRLNTLLGEVDDGTRAEVRALVAGELGRTNNGGFSLAQFLTATGNGRGAKVDRRAARLLFGESGVEAINDLRTLAEAKVAATERTNYSNTGGIVQRTGRGLRTMILGGLGLSEAGVTGGAVAVGASGLIQRMGEQRAVRLLTNPDFTGWLRRLPETDNPRAIDGAFARLGRVAARDAQFQSDIQAFQQALIGAANDNAVVAGNVAASPDQQQEP